MSHVLLGGGLRGAGVYGVCPGQLGLTLGAHISMVMAGQSSGVPAGSDPGSTPPSLYDFE